MGFQAQEMSMIEEMKQAVRRLNEAADAYYSGRGELMTDFEWDALFDRVKELEKKTGVILDDSPTQRVSSDNLAGRKEAHEHPALSLAKTKSVAELASWASLKRVWLSWKLDGLTLVVTYDGGKLKSVVTRGDGHVGTNITHLSAGITGILDEIDYKGHLVLRGEAVISYADFEEFLATSQEVYSNPRNLASGSLSLKDINELKLRKIRWVVFSIVDSDEKFTTKDKTVSFITSLGFEHVESELVVEPTQQTLAEVIDGWTYKVTSRINPYPVDGLVVSYDDLEYAASGSVTGHHAIRSGIAFKWKDESAFTTLERIEWSTAVASISPVAVFKSVELEGTIVKRASLCNISECERLGIAGSGTEIEVIKANKIIPKIVSVKAPCGEFEVPSFCPVCGAPTEINISESGTKTLRCTSAKCPARELRKFMRFVSKAGANIDGLAGKTLARFIDCGWIKNFGDIYRLGSHKNDIARLEGFGEKSAEKIVDSIESARTIDAVKFINALSIPLCGPDVARKFLSAYSVVELFEVASKAEEEVFSDIDGIGPAKSAEFVRWCHDEENIALVRDVLSEVTLEEFKEPAGGKCSGFIFVITGDVTHYANRDEFKAYVISQGGKVASAVSSKTSFLVNNDATSSSSKNKKAAALSIPIITEDEFLARFG